MADRLASRSGCAQQLGAPAAPRPRARRCAAQGQGQGRKEGRRLRATALEAPVLQQGGAAATTAPPPAPPPTAPATEGAMVTQEQLRGLEARLDGGASVAALRRFNNALDRLTAADWEPKLRRVMHELAFNLESFNPVFTAVLLKLQCTIGYTPYVARDAALKRLIQPLAGEYGMHNGQAQGKTHRELFSNFYTDLLREPLGATLDGDPRPPAGVALFQQMTRDVLGGGGCADPVEQAAYALGYNLAVEYLADYEKVWMLDSFRGLSARVLAPLGRPLRDWLFLEVHAEGEREHAALGHAAVMDVVEGRHAPLLARAMADHDRDFAAFYSHLAALLE